jgi:hypothetical protein
MAFTTDMAAAARRHLVAANELSPRSSGVAGYLFGIAAECATKAMMYEAGIPRVEDRREDPYFAHFPELKTMLRDKVQGRRATSLAKFVMSDSFMSNWDTKMRYCDGQEIRLPWVQNWAEQARQIVASIGT